jgi:hypothetical protein
MRTADIRTGNETDRHCAASGRLPRVLYTLRYLIIL